MAQPACPETPVYSLCDLVFELNDAEAADHPNPFQSVRMHAEVRSPEARTYLIHAFWDGGRRMVIRFTPLIPGEWIFRVTSNVPRFEGMEGRINATPSDSRGFVVVQNTRHFSHTDDPVRPTPHLWMGDTSYRFAVMDRQLFERMVDVRAEQKFNHIRGLVTGDFPGMDQALAADGTPNPAYFQELDQRILYMNRQGITADLVLAGDQNHLAELFPSWQERQRYIEYVVSRYAAMNVTWQGVQEFEEYEDGRPLLNEIGTLIKKLDPYDHPRSTHTNTTSAPLLQDGWMDYIAYQTSDIAVLSIEHEMYPRPQVNTEFGYENSGAGASHSHHVGTDAFRKRLWNNTMSGAHPTYGNTGTYGGRDFEPDAKYLDAPGAAQMTAWYDIMSRTRHWELEPFFDVDGGRALALTGVEYMVYIEEPGPVEILVEKRKYDVYWINPITGESVQIKKEKEFKGEQFSGTPPNLNHDWILHLSRDGRKASMAQRWHFASRRIPVQEIEYDPARRPYELVEPAGTELSLSKPIPFSVKLNRETRATSNMRFMLTGEIAGGSHGYRVLATGTTGEFRVPASFGRLPANLNLRLLGMNALGKVYSLNRVFTLIE